MADAETTPVAGPGGEGASSLARGAFTQVPIEIVISVGRARPLVRDLLRLSARQRPAA
jgi:flagellar motor switch protein FliN